MKKSKKSQASSKTLIPKKKKKKNAVAVTPKVPKVLTFKQKMEFLKSKESFKKKISIDKQRFTLVVTMCSVLYIIGLLLPFVYRDDEPGNFRGIEIFSFGVVHLSVMALVCVLSIIGLIEEKNFSWIFLILINLCMIEPTVNILFVIQTVPFNGLIRIIGPGFFMVPIGGYIGIFGAILLLFNRIYFGK
ncbi:MAG: hypothetical protein PVH61_09820 [Candidatus Aminicenantes bacterium]